MKKIAILLLIIVSVSAQTSVSGLISTDTKWTKNNSPYIIDGKVSIASVLTIEAGVTVKLNQTSETSLNVLSGGALVIAGSYEDSVHFIPNTKGIRYSRVISFPEESEVINNSSIKYATFRDINSSDCLIFLKKAKNSFSIENSVFERDSTYGSIGNGGGSNGVISLSMNSSSYNLEIKDCKFLNNYSTDRGAAVSIYASSPTFRNCLFKNNYSTENGGAVHFYNGTSNGVFLNCTFISNESAKNGGAIGHYYSNYLQVRNSTFIGNKAADGAAIYNDWNGSYGYGYIKIVGSYFYDNVSTASGGAIIRNNPYPWNSSDDQGGDPSINGNAFYSNNTDYIFKLQDNNKSSFETHELINNYWGFKDSTQIAQNIYDFYEDSNYETDKADFIPFLFAPNDTLVGSPSSINSIKLKTNLSYQTELNQNNTINTEDTIFVEVQGTDSDKYSRGLSVILAINRVNQDTIVKTLLETSENSGIYRGEVYTSTTTNKANDILKYSNDNSLLFLSRMNKEKKISFNNSIPVIAAVSDVTINEDESSTVTLSATDADGDAITYSAVSDTNAVTVSVSSATLTLTPNPNWNGVANIKAYASDGSAKDSTSFKLTVTAVNDAPIISAIPDDLTNEETEKAIVVGASDVEGDALTYTASSDTSAVGITVSSDTLKLTPATNYTGSAKITVVVSDNALKDTTSFNFKVININDSPVISTLSDVTINEDETGTATLSATDIDGDAITYSAVSDTNAVTVSVSSATLTLTPNPNWNGVANIKAYASDGTSKDSTTFKLTVTPVQDAPTAFEWVSSALDTVNITQSNLADTYTLQWGVSTDAADGDSINYLLYAQIGVYPAEEIYDTTSLSIPLTYQEILEGVFEGSPVNGATVRFNVKATDGVDTVDVTGENRVIYVNRYDYLSTESEGVPTEFALHENYPNPFNPSTTLRFDLPEASNITLTIYNMLGQKIRTYDMQSAAAGYHTLKWNATNDYGDPVGAGVYLYQLQTKDFVKTRKMVLLK